MSDGYDDETDQDVAVVATISPEGQPRVAIDVTTVDGPTTIYLTVEEAHAFTREVREAANDAYVQAKLEEARNV